MAMDPDVQVVIDVLEAKVVELENKVVNLEARPNGRVIKDQIINYEEGPSDTFIRSLV